VIGTLAAGMLFRRHGRLSAMFSSYIELMVPSLVAVTIASNALFRWGTGDLSARRWYIFAIPLASLAAWSVLKAWDWRVRLMLHVLWITSMGAIAISYQ
jgi:hypothetical protein